MKTYAFGLLVAAALLTACGGGDDEQTDSGSQSEMPCKYRPDCSAGPPEGSEYPATPEAPASAASAP